MLLDLFVGVAAALVVSCIVCAAMIKNGPLDLPTVARKAHKAPTPTSGGIGIGLGFAAGLILLCLVSSLWGDAFASEGLIRVAAGAIFIYGFLAVGFVDDAHPLSARLKFALFAVLSIGLVLSVGVVEKLPLGWEQTLAVGLWGGLIGTTLWMFVLVNCVNFMDGANGLSMGSVAVGMLTLAAIAYADEAPSVLAVVACAAAALGGFLIWNFPNGKLFAGDSGALFAGAVAGASALLIIRHTDLSPFIAPIVFFPLLADALMTLAWRIQRGRSLFDGHSEHLYQIAMRAGWSHARVAVMYWAIAGLCGVIAYAVSRAPQTGAAWIALCALAAVALVVSSFVRREARKRGIEWKP